MLERQHLSIIREVSRTGSVTAAAERLNISQSAVSHAIAKLEDRLQITLWHKKGRMLQLTPAGHYLLALAERILPELEHAERVLSDMSRGRRGVLRIGMECHPCEKWLMRVTGPFLAEWPDVDLEVRAAFRFDGVAALQAGEIDVLVTPDPVQLSDLRFRPVFDYELVLVVHADHPLAGRGFVVPEDLVDQDLFTVPVASDRLDIYTRFLIPAERRPARRIGIETVELMLQLVSAGRGVSVLPDWLVQEEGKDLPVRAVRIGPKGIKKSINVGCREIDLSVDYLIAFANLAGRVRP
jgi:LysR family transcriptional regulator for metE and metH